MPLAPCRLRCVCCATCSTRCVPYHVSYQLCSSAVWRAHVSAQGVNGEPGTVTVWHGSYEEYKEKLQNEFATSGLVSNGTVKGVK